VLIADKFEKVGVDGLKELGCSVVSRPEAKAEELPQLIRENDPHILIVRGTKVSGDALKAGTALTLVIRAGAGIDTIDVSQTSTDYLALNHSSYAEKSALLADISLLLQTGERPPETRIPILQRITTPKGDFWRYPLIPR